MPEDIVFPDKNEGEFIDIAVKLGYDSLILAYEFRSSSDFKKIKERFEKLKQKHKDIKLKLAASASQKNVLKTKQSSDFVLTQAENDARTVIEKFRPKLIFDLEMSKRKDFIHHRNSGLNHILCKIANENKVTIGFSFRSILKNKKFRPVMIGRIKQNIKLCKKYKTQIMIASFAEDPYEMRSPHDIAAFFKILGK